MNRLTLDIINQKEPKDLESVPATIKRKHVLVNLADVTAWRAEAKTLNLAPCCTGCLGGYVHILEQSVVKVPDILKVIARLKIWLHSHQALLVSFLNIDKFTWKGKWR